MLLDRGLVFAAAELYGCGSMFAVGQSTWRACLVELCVLHVCILASPHNQLHASRCCCICFLACCSYCFVEAVRSDSFQCRELLWRRNATCTATYLLRFLTWPQNVACAVPLGEPALLLLCIVVGGQCAHLVQLRPDWTSLTNRTLVAYHVKLGDVYGVILA